jgi:hypothetical protein
MLLFSRTLTLGGNPRSSMAWASEMTAYVNANSDLEVALWMYNFGEPLGTVAWTSIVDSQAALTAGTAGLLANDGYYDMIEKGEAFATTPGIDRLRDIVSFDASGGPTAVGSVSTVTTATAMVDHMADALGWSVEMAQFAAQTTGVPVAVATSVFGQMGEVAWISVQPDQASADAANAKLSASAEYLERLTKTTELIIPGSGHVSHLTRIA